ncbi:MAG: HGxxPAAW family protein [Nocardioidaceae bacterium]
MAQAHHGNTPAAWTAVSLALVAFVVGGVGLMVGTWLVFWLGVALLAVAAVVGKVMQAMGLGDSSR